MRDAPVPNFTFGEDREEAGTGDIVGKTGERERRKVEGETRRLSKGEGGRISVRRRRRE